jgi:predicted Fe-S protein YdhL (DUF1289 family)
MGLSLFHIGTNHFDQLGRAFCAIGVGFVVRVHDVVADMILHQLGGERCTRGEEAPDMKKDDPCISVCQFDGETGWCAGCGRTIPEIKAWRKLTPYRRTALIRDLPGRIKQVSDP